LKWIENEGNKIIYVKTITFRKLQITRAASLVQLLVPSRFEYKEFQTGRGAWRGSTCSRRPEGLASLEYDPLGLVTSVIPDRGVPLHGEAGCQGQCQLRVREAGKMEIPPGFSYTAGSE
jgi:hypothetical protein